MDILRTLRPLGVFFFSCGSTLFPINISQLSLIKQYAICHSLLYHPEHSKWKQKGVVEAFGADIVENPYAPLFFFVHFSKALLSIRNGGNDVLSYKYKSVSSSSLEMVMKLTSLTLHFSGPSKTAVHLTC